MAAVVNETIAALIADMRAGVLKSGELLPPTDELCKRFKCSPASIERALKSLARDGYVKRVRRKGTIVEANIPSLAKPGICLLQTDDPHFNYLFTNAIFALLTEHGHQVEIVPFIGDLTSVETTIENLQRRLGNLDVLVALRAYFPSLGKEVAASFERICDRFARFITIGELGQAHPRPSALTVGIDQMQMHRMVLEYLVEHGHRRIAITAGFSPDEISPVTENARFAGHLLELLGGQLTPVYFGRDYISKLPELFRREKVTAYWPITDDQAVAAINHFHLQGLRVPEDISVLGRNDTPWCEQSAPALSSVSLNPTAVAGAILDLVNAEKPKRLTLVEAKIVERNSIKSLV